MRKSFMALSALAVGIALPLSGAVAQSLQTWTNWIDLCNTDYPITMVGTDPSTTNMMTTIPVYIIPIKMVYQNGSSQPVIFDPLFDKWNGITIKDALLRSPLFRSFDWNWGGTDLGNTQYEDAFQRGSFWGDILINPSYHVVFASPIILPEQEIEPTAAQGGVVGRDGENNPIGHMNRYDNGDAQGFDTYLRKFITSFPQITPSALVLFVTDDILVIFNPYGGNHPGYHSSYINTIGQQQTYVWASFWNYFDGPEKDISAFGHELGEWYDDPFYGTDTNSSPCGDLEVGDPFEGVPNRYVTVTDSDGYTWNPQALTFLTYFGASSDFSVNSWLDNVKNFTSVCEANAKRFKRLRHIRFKH